MKPLRRSALVLLLCGSPVAAVAQNASGPASLLDRPARLDVRDVSLEVALNRLSRRAAVQVAFSPDLANRAGLVSCSCIDASVREALDTLLASTSLVYEQSGSRVVVRPEVVVGTNGGSVSRPESTSEPRRITGMVFGEVLAAPDSQPITGARIRVTGRIGEARSDSRGQFGLALPGGTYELLVRALGFAPQAVGNLQIAEDGVRPLTILLEPAPLRLSDIVVTPSTYGVLTEDRFRVAHSLTREDVQTRPHIGEDIYRAVDRLPGLATHDITAKFHVRGAPSDQVLHLLDGLELYDAFHLKDAEGVFSIIDVESVEDIDLITGGFSAEHGDRLAGVFSMRTTTPPPDRTTTTLGLSIQNLTFKSQGGFAGGKGAWLASARRGYLDIILELTESDSNISPTYYDVFTKAQYQIHPRHLLSAHVLHAGDRVSSIENDGTELDSRWGSSYVWFGWRAEYTHLLSSRTILSAGRITRERIGADYRDDGQERWLTVDDRASYDYVGLKQDWEYLATGSWLARWGFDVRRGRTDYDYFRARAIWFPNLTDPLGDPWVLNADTVSILADPAGSEVGAYFSNRFRPTEWLTTELGVRYDHQSHTGDHSIGPRVNVVLQLAPRTSLRGAWGLYHQSHALPDLQVADGVDEFYPAQRAEHRIVGLEHRLPSDVSIRLEAYERLTSNPWPEFRSLEAQIEEVPEEGPGDRIRIAPTRGRARGVELFVKRDPGGRFAWAFSYVLAVAEDRITRTWVPRPFDQRHSLHLEFSYRPDPRWSLSWAWQYHSAWPGTALVATVDTLATGDLYVRTRYEPLYGERMPPYHRFDARVSRHIPLGGGILSIFLDVLNLYDRENPLAFEHGVFWSGGPRVTVDRGVHQQAGVLPTIGARWQF